MKKITETELKNKVSRLREYLTVLEAGYVAPGTPPGMGQNGPTKAAAMGQDPSNPINQVKPQDSLSPGEQIVPPATQSTKPAPTGAWPADVNAIKAFQKANGLTADGLIGRKTYTALTQQGLKPPVGFGIATDKAPAKPAQSTKPAAPTAPAAPAAPAAPTGTTAQGDDEGNTTITKPDGTTQVVGPDGNVIKPGTNPNLPQNKPVAAAPAAAPAASTQTDDDGNTLVTTASGVTSVLGPDGKPLPNGGRVTPTATQSTKPATPNPYKDPAQAAKFAALTPQDQAWLTKGGGVPDITDDLILRRAPNGGKPAAAAPAPTATAGTPPPTTESVGFQNDELSRIVSLVHHR